MNQIWIQLDPATNAVRVRHTCATVAELLLLLKRVEFDVVARAAEPTSPIATPTGDAVRRILDPNAAIGQKD